MSHIERANQRGKFSENEIRAKVRESKQFWDSPAGRRAKAEAESRAARNKKIPAKFPGLAKRASQSKTGSDPLTRHCENILRRVESNTPKI